MRILGFLMCLLATPAFANEMPYDSWLAAFKKEAATQGISSKTLDSAFSEKQPIADIIRLDRKQPEGTKTLYEYLEIVISDRRIADGIVRHSEHQSLLKKIEQEYGVDSEAIIALWGIETNYGENTGNYSVVDALATLAYDGRRSDYFRGELLNALKIIDAGNVTSDAMFGSWAGAMGQCQFMPSSYLRYAVDHNKDGKRDIWWTTEDVFASIANYLKSEGWKQGGEIAMPVILPANFSDTLMGHKIMRTTSEWSALGVKYNDGSKLVDNGESASIVMIGSGSEEVPYIVYNNYKVLLRWNRSGYFVTGVDMLMEAIRAGQGKISPAS